MVIKGIDVSAYQADINWEEVMKSGIKFAILRCGYGGDYKKQDDTKFARNVAECERLGMPYGVYLFSYATSVDKAKSEAAHVIRLLKNHKPSYPVYYDLEDNNTTGKCSKKVIGDMAETFCKAIAGAGFKPAIYANKYWFTSILTDSRFNKWDKWVAQYASKCTYTGDYQMWQFTSTGRVPGISGNVDMDYCYVDYPGMIEKKIEYQAHCQSYGWMEWQHDGQTAGTVGHAKRMEAIKIQGPSLDISYEVHVQSKGWMPAKKNGAAAGTTGQSLRMEAIKINCNKPITYRAHIQGIGWMPWVKNGEVAGTTGKGKRLEAIEIKVIE